MEEISSSIQHCHSVIHPLLEVGGRDSASCVSISAEICYAHHKQNRPIHFSTVLSKCL
jgi:hypothetical protein